VEVLRWIGDGCPDGVMTGEGHFERISAGALRNRGLVTTSGARKTWSATITKAGKEYLARVDGPNPPIPREPNRPAAQQLVDDLIAAGGSLKVPRRYGRLGAGQPDYERRVELAEERGKVPAAKRLVVTRTRDELRIDLRDAPDGTPTQAFPVPVPDRVGRYHPVVVEFRNRADRREISRAQLSRIGRVLHGLVVESEQRGYTVDGPSESAFPDRSQPVWSGDADGHLRIRVEEVTVTLRLREDGVRGRAIYPRHDYRYQDPDIPARRTNEQEAKGTVRISILAPRSRSSRQASWGDGKRQTLEECLPAVLMEVEARAAEERERLEIERTEAERRRQAWEDAMARAKQRHTEHHRSGILDTQIAAWQRAQAIRSYCDAIEQDRPGDADAVGWADWARAFADAIDPLGAILITPQPPADPSADDLRPFLEGWSPYGPDQAARLWR